MIPCRLAKAGVGPVVPRRWMRTEYEVFFPLLWVLWSWHEKEKPTIPRDTKKQSHTLDPTADANMFEFRFYGSSHQTPLGRSDCACVVDRFSTGTKMSRRGTFCASIDKIEKSCAHHCRRLSRRSTMASIAKERSELVAEGGCLILDSPSPASSCMFRSPA